MYNQLSFGGLEFEMYYLGVVACSIVTFPSCHFEAKDDLLLSKDKVTYCTVR